MPRNKNRYSDVGRIRLNKPIWEDLRFPAQGIQIGNLSTPPTQNATTGLLEFAHTSTQTIGVLAQFPHSWKEGSVISPHVHWRKTTNAAGGVQWTLRYKWIENGEVEPAWSSIINSTLISALDPGSTQASAISTFGEISGAGKSISSMLLIQLGRDHDAAGDTYGAAATLYEFDIHYQIDTLGSDEEFTKDV